MKNAIKSIPNELKTEMKTKIGQVLETIKPYLNATDDDPNNRGKSMGVANAKTYVKTAHQNAVEHSLLFNLAFDLVNFGNRIDHQDYLESLVTALKSTIDIVEDELHTNGRNLMKEANDIRNVFKITAKKLPEYKNVFDDVNKYYNARGSRSEQTKKVNEEIKKLKNNQKEN
ncbi:MAG: hypothetical protein RL757_417 [Bacteroidota bacterium]|jgi:ABC-type transporter Mla subunit MlaD